jgi:hypothetical protein
VKQEIDGWLDVAGIEKGPIFRRVLANGRVGKDGLTDRAVWQLVREYAAQIGIGEPAPPSRPDTTQPCRKHTMNCAPPFVTNREQADLRPRRSTNRCYRVRVPLCFAPILQ